MDDEKRAPKEAEPEGSAANDKGAAPGTTEPDSEEGALAMSMQTDEEPKKEADLSTMTEEEQIEYTTRMSMQDSDKGAAPGTPTKPDSEEGALAMSMQTDEEPKKEADLSTMTEEEQIEYARRMSMQDSDKAERQRVVADVDRMEEERRCPDCEQIRMYIEPQERYQTQNEHWHFCLKNPFNVRLKQTCDKMLKMKKKEDKDKD